jgi:TolB protein
MTQYIKLQLIISTMFFLAAANCFAQYDYIDIKNPSLRKIPIAIPVFKTTPGSGDLSASASDLAVEDLNFTGYFKILNRGAFLMDPNNPVTDAASIVFRNWTTVGAELLITGNINTQGDQVDMALRLFDPFKGELLVGKRYKGFQKDFRKMIRRFCSEVIHHLTGTWGVFDSQIAFVSNGSGHKEIYICDFDGKNARAITRFNSITLTPAWSSDGQWIAYTSYAQGRPDLYIKSISGGRGTVFSKDGLNTTPAWRPGEFQLAATLSFSGDQDIYLLTGQGKILKPLTKSWGIDTSPTWSPDGRKIAFVSSRAGSPQIYIKDVGSGRVERITYEGKYNTQPEWSPRGGTIVYSAVERGEINIRTLDLRTRQSISLTYRSGKNESPSWSPDGSLIAFSSSREGASRIYIMNAYGTDQRRLLKLSGEQFSPEWSPRIGGP